MIYLIATGLPPGGSSTVHIYTHTIHRTTQNKQYIEQHKNLTNKNRNLDKKNLKPKHLIKIFMSLLRNF